MGVENSGVLYALWSYPAQAADELSFKDGDMVTILQKPEGSDWWWASLCGREGLVPNNYFGVRKQHDDNTEHHFVPSLLFRNNVRMCFLSVSFSFSQRFDQSLSAESPSAISPGGNQNTLPSALLFERTVCEVL